jgi:hypothetical protein
VGVLALVLRGVVLVHSSLLHFSMVRCELEERTKAERV